MTINETLDTILAYYTQPGRMSDAGEYAPLFGAIPNGIAETVQTLQGLLLHIFWADRYGVNLSEERKAEVTIRPVRAKLSRLFEIDPRPLTTPRLPELRLVGNCRDFSLLLASILKQHGIPARARCGFGTYFMPGHFEDHWMTEYWAPDPSPSGGRWVQVDAQLDHFQQEVLGIQFNTLDMPKGQFVLAGEAWQMCRRGEANPDDFGIFEWHGWDFIKGNVLRDLLSLNSIEVLPWDSWGLNEAPVAEFTPGQMALVDRAAELSLLGNDGFSQVRALYEQNEPLHIPAGWER